MKPLRLVLAFCIVNFVAISNCQEPAAETCEYASFLDALPGGTFGDTSFFKMAVKLSGYQVR